jgi:hypothetical protein
MGITPSVACIFTKHTWNMDAWQLVHHGSPATTLEALWTHMQTVWRKIPQENIQACCDSMPQ